MRFKAGAFLVRRLVWKCHGGRQGSSPLPRCSGPRVERRADPRASKGGGIQADRGSWKLGDMTPQMQGGVSTQILEKDADNAQTMGDAVTHQVSGDHSRWTVSGG